MSVRENLQAAIRAYAQEARHIPSAQNLVERLQEVSQDVARLPDPQSRGVGSVPKQYEGEAPTPGQQAAGGVHIHIHTDGGGAPKFPDRSQVMARLRGRS